MQEGQNELKHDDGDEDEEQGHYIDKVGEVEEKYYDDKEEFEDGAKGAEQVKSALLKRIVSFLLLVKYYLCANLTMARI